MSLSRQELNDAMVQTKQDIFRLKYDLGETVDPRKEREIKKKLRELQILHYWQLKILERMEKSE